MNIGRLIRILAALELPLILAIAPLLLMPSPRRAVALLLVPLLWGCSWLTTRRLVPLTPVNTSLWALLGLAALSLLVTPDAVFSLAKITGVALGITLYWALVRWTSTLRRTVWAAGAFIGSAAALSVLGLLGARWRTDKLPIVAPIIDALPALIRGIPGAVEGFNPNAVAGCLILFLPVQVSVLANRDRQLPLWGKALQLTLLFLTAGTLILLQSRGAWLGLGIGGVLYLIIRRPARYVPVVAATVALGVLVFSQISPAALSTPLVTGSETIASRVELWSRGIYIVRDHPFTGIGMNNFRVVMPRLYPAFSLAPDVDVAHAHNQLLQTALDLGVPGLIAYLALWFGSVFTMTRALRVARARLDRALLSGVLVGLLAHFCFGLTDAIPLGAKVGVTYWFALALGMAVACRVLADHRAGPLNGQTAP